MGSKPDTVKAPKANYSADMQKYVSALQKSLPGVLGLEQQYRPEFGDLNLADIGNFLVGRNGQEGIFGLSGQATQAGIDQYGQAQAQNLGQLQGLVPGQRSFLQSLNPQGAGMVDNATMAAQNAYRSAQGLTPQEERSAQQFAREGYAARGRINDNASIAGELLNRDSMLGQKRQEAAQLGQQAYGMSQGFYSQPGLQMLNSTPAGMQQGNQLLGYGLGAVGANVPQMVDVGMGFNLGAAERQNQLAAQAANAQSQASYSSGIWSGIGGIAGGIGSAFAALK